ncbi:MAG: SUMF1/EgtB/PvdO family nonheme iron enzyme [Phycisphaerales bacterium]|nr:SUMF1/EgtB/PvdO family nonheme iron enzyme [Phycisphaerales bacterium]
MNTYSRFAAIVVLSIASSASADVFGTGENQFTIDFVPISGETNPTSGPGIVSNDYRIGTFEITNGQWGKFEAAYGEVAGGNGGYLYDSYWTGESVPTNRVSWFEAAQFVNYLNTSKGHQPAYKFTGTQGSDDYMLDTWAPAEADSGTNRYRHKDAVYYMPTEDEWIKAGYWNGTNLQDYATKSGETLHQGDGTSGTGWNYWDDGYATEPVGPWDVGSGSEELNGTFDMMGNVWEWLESPYNDPTFGPDSSRWLGGGSYNDLDVTNLASFDLGSTYPSYETNTLGFRVAAEVPEPSALSLLSLGGLILIRCRQ